MNIPVTVFAGENISITDITEKDILEKSYNNNNASTITGNCGDDIQWTYDITSNQLTLSGTGIMYDYTTVNSYYEGITTDVPWGDYLDLIKNIKVESGITSIGNSSFSDCSALVNINLPSTLIKIGNDAFARCSSLSSISIPNGVTVIGKGAFTGCNEITDIVIPDGVTTLENSVFSACSKLNSITLSKNLVTIERAAFNSCSALSNITLPNTLSDIKYAAFFLCKSLEKLIIYNDNINIETEVFTGCSSNLTLYGNSNSKAALYSQNEGIKFVAFNISLETVSEFTIDPIKKGELDNHIVVNGTLILSDNIESSPDTLASEINNITWKSNNPDIAEVTNCNGINSTDNKQSSLFITITPYKIGTITITGTTSNNITASCDITITNNNKTDVKDSEKYFQNTLTELVSTYGLFKTNQSGTMHNTEDKWLNPNGVISATILDFDSDGFDEMLVCYADSSAASEGYVQIIMNMYEIIDKKVILEDSVPFIQWKNNNQAYDPIQLIQFCNSLFSVNAIRKNGIYYIICEKSLLAQAFANGSSQNYWVLVYQNNKLQYSSSFSQTAGGSSGFVYTGYEFKYGIVNDSKVYYNQSYSYDGYGESPLYSDFNTAIKEFFKKFNIFLSDDILHEYGGRMKTILSDDNDIINIFELKNELINSDYKTNTHMFKTTLKTYGIDEILNFEIADKGNHNYIFQYKGIDYVSSAYNDFSDNSEWQTIEEATISSGKFDWANAVVSAFSVNDGSDDALNVDVNNESAIFKLNVAGSIISMLHGFITGGKEGVTDIKLKLQSNGINNRMLLMYGNPIEAVYSGKTLWLSDILIKAHSGESAYFLWASKDEDKILRNVFKGLNKDGKYSMKITYSKAENYKDSPYKYTIVIADNQKIYQYPILHNATKMEVYYKPDGGKNEFLFDATQLINSEKIELEEQIGKDIIDFLNAGTWNKKAKNQTIRVKENHIKTIGDKPFYLKAKAKTSLSYMSKNKNVATVNSNGEIDIKNIGTAIIQITATGTQKYIKKIKNIIITVNPKHTNITKTIRINSKNALIKWKKSKGVDGYIIEISQNPNMHNSTKMTIIGEEKAFKKIHSLQTGKKYYVRIRSFKKVNEKTYKSKWCNTKSIAKNK